MHIDIYVFGKLKDKFDTREVGVNVKRRKTLVKWRL